MRIAATLALSACIAVAQTQTGKPGVTDPIKDPQQVPGNPHPGPIPRATPPPAETAPGDVDQTRSQDKANKKKTKKITKKEAVNR